MIEVLAAGLYSSIQDQGRFGYRHLGVPVSGCMDNFSAQMANALVNNDKQAAVLEMMYQGATLRFNHASYIAITGATCPILLNNNFIDANRVQRINKNDILKIGRVTQGVFAYLTIAGGFESQKVLNSCSHYQNITHHKRISKGDLLQHHMYSNEILNRSVIKQDNRYFSKNRLSVFKGPEFDYLDLKTQKILFKQKFTLSPNCNRMAYKLIKNTALTADEIITSCVQPGTIQLTPSGELIILMRDCQTTGGYARVLQLHEQAFNQLAQKPIGSHISFKIASVNQH